MPSLLVDKIREAWNTLDHGQQISLSILAPCAVMVLALAVVSLRSSVSMPFRAPLALLTQSDQLIAQQRALSAQQDAKDASKTKDTDGDGLSDYDEVNIYHTSPYLADTDSDGVPDGVEVKLGTDPNCPPNRDCYGFAAANPNAVLQADVPTTTAQQALPPGAQMETPPSPVGLSAKDARQYLQRNQLATQDQLSALPDDSVLELYRRAYSDLIGSQASSTAVTSPSSTSTPSTP